MPAATPSIAITEINSRSQGAPVPKVSVAMIAYNHEKFIAQAVESVMMQETSFPFELVLSEDCSTDSTREIVLGLQKKYPDRIRLLLPDKNIGMVSNNIQTFLACTGEYVALLEGDDYWSSPDKLQKQVELLESHPEYSACAALTRVVAEDDSSEEFYIPSKRTSSRVFTTESLLRKNSIATASVMYRNILREINFAPLLHLKMTDWPLHILVSLRGPVGYIPEEMAVYRQHAGGVWTSAGLVSKLQAMIEMYSALEAMLPGKYRSAVTAGIVKAYQSISIEHLRNGNRRTSCASALKSLASIPVAEMLAFKWHLKRSATLLLGSCLLSVSRVERLLR